MKTLCSVLAAVILTSMVSVAQAAENPTGTWKWTIKFNDQTREATLKLKLDGETLSGAMLGRNDKETAIENATFKDDEVAFSITRERNGNKSTQQFKGKVSGDTLTGTIEFERDGEKRSRPWEAKRAAE